MTNILIIIAMLALSISQLHLLKVYRQLENKIMRAEDRYLELAAITLRRKENGKEELHPERPVQ